MLQLALYLYLYTSVITLLGHFRCCFNPNGICTLCYTLPHFCPINIYQHTTHSFAHFCPIAFTLLPSLPSHPFPPPLPPPSPSDAIECNRAFISQYGSDHMPNAQQQFSDGLGSDFSPHEVRNSVYRPLHPTPGMPPASAAMATPIVTPKVEPIDLHYHQPTSFVSCPPGPAPCDNDITIPQTLAYSSQPEQVFTTSPPVTPPTGTPVFSNVDHTGQFQPVQTGPMQSMSSITSPHEGYPIGYMTPSSSGSESNSHSHFSPHGAHTEDGAFSSPNIHSHGYHSNLEGFPLSTSSRSSYGSQGHLPHMASMATQPRGSVEDDGYVTDVFSPPTTVPCTEGLPADLSSMCTIYFDPNSVPYPMATGRMGSYQQPPLYCQPIHETH